MRSTSDVPIGRSSSGLTATSHPAVPAGTDANRWTHGPPGSSRAGRLVGQERRVGWAEGRRAFGSRRHEVPRPLRSTTADSSISPGTQATAAMPSDVRSTLVASVWNRGRRIGDPHSPDQPADHHVLPFQVA